MRKLARFLGLMLLILTTSIFTSCKEPKPEPKVYTVTFDAAGGSEVAAIQVKSGEKAVQPEEPTKEGYVFDAWYNGDVEYDWETPVTANLTLTAKWTDKTYTVTFDVEGIEAQEVKHKDKVTKPAEDPTKEGFVFAGWLNGETAYDFELPVTSDLALTAKWDVVKYKITFDVEGVKAIEVEHGKVATKPETDPTKEGYTFEGWMNGKVVYDWTAEVTSDLTLTASWEINEYTVTFDSDGGSEVAAAKVKYNETVKEPTAPTKEGFDFVGWYEGETKFDFATKITKDISLTAKWEEKKATEPEVTYDEVTVDGNTTTILRPTMETAWGATVKGNVISFSGNSAAKWTYKDITNYTFVEIFYETTKESNIKLTMKSYDGDKNHENVGFPELKTSGSLKYSIGHFKDVNKDFSHIVLANNANDNDWANGSPTWDDDWSITITKIVLTIVESTGEKVLFDPATFEGETIELDGELYAVVTVDGYNTTFKIDPAVDCSAVSTFKAKMCAKEANAQYNFTVRIADEFGADISSMNYYNVESTPKVCSAGYAEKTSWNSVSETNIATTLQPMVQDTANNYAAVSGFVVYIGKVYAE